ncbi:hypothetical protein FDECE_4016 [Fusarium decemcellulare]|nr:hypothetical protein FDECE_4016 [Fusarium decemcellulare]
MTPGDDDQNANLQRNACMASLEPITVPFSATDGRFWPKEKDQNLDIEGIWWSQEFPVQWYPLHCCRANETLSRLKPDLDGVLFEASRSQTLPALLNTSLIHRFSKKRTIRCELRPEDRFVLRMAGVATKSSTTIALSGSVWILCNGGAFENKIRKRLDSLPWLKFPQYLPVHCTDLPELAVGQPGTQLLDSSDLDGNGLEFEWGEKLHLHIERASSGSPCGLLCCATVTKDGHVIDQRISRIGGALKVNGSGPMAVTAAHGMLTHFLMHERWKTETENEEDTNSEIEDDERSPELPVMYGALECKPESGWKSVSPFDSISFIGLGKPSSEMKGKWTLQLPEDGRSTDFTLLDPNGIKALRNVNSYRLNDGTVCITTHDESKDVGLEDVQISVLLGQDDAIQGKLLPGELDVFLNGIQFVTRKIELPGALARGTSGAWVVSGQTLLGMIFAIFPREPYALILTAAQLLADIKQRCQAARTVDLPIDSHSHGMARGSTWDLYFSEDVPLSEQAMMDMMLTEDDVDSRLILHAAANGHETVLKQLLETGVDVEFRDRDRCTALSVDPNLKDMGGRTPLSFAAERGHEAVVQLLLDSGRVNPNLKDNSGWTPLLYAARVDPNLENTGGRTPLSFAAEYGHEAVVKLFLDSSQANLDSNDAYGRTPLVFAAGCGHEAVVQLLLDSGQVNPDPRNAHGLTPLSSAAKRGSEAIARALLDKGAETERTSPLGQTALSLAAENGQEAIVSFLLKNRAEVDAKDQLQHTPLSFAAAEGRKAVIGLLLDGGADIEAMGHWHQTPLSRAVENGHEAAVELLIERGADIEAGDHWGRTPLTLAAKQGHEAVVKLLLEKGADIEVSLLRAASEGDEALIRLLLDKGADIEVEDNQGRTPLLFAALKGHNDVVELLLQKGADVEAKDSDWGRMPLSWAASRGHEAIVRQLADKGADIEGKDRKWSRTPLLFATANGHEDVVWLLLERGADIEAKDDRDQTPLSVAAEKGHEDIVKLLLDKGADTEAKDHRGRTPLMLAAENEHEVIVELLQPPT